MLLTIQFIDLVGVSSPLAAQLNKSFTLSASHESRHMLGPTSTSQPLTPDKFCSIEIIMQSNTLIT